MTRRVLAIGGIAALLTAGAASAISPEGPRLAFIKWGPNANRLELLSLAADGSRLERISGGLKVVKGRRPVPLDHPSWSPDGSLIAFVGNINSRTAILVAASDGSGLHAVPGTVGAEDPVFAPDGRTIAFARSRFRFPHLDRKHLDRKHVLKSLRRIYSSTTTWTIGIDGSGAERLTPWRNGLHNTPSSFSPDGASLALSRENRDGTEATVLNLATGQSSVLALNATEPAYSPDGTRIAFVSYRDRNVDPHGGFDGPVIVSELYVLDLASGGLTRVTRTRTRQENAPSWDPSGERLAYTQSTGNSLIELGLTDVVMEVNADGTCPTRVFGEPAKPHSRRSVGLYGPVWQPGLGREAGPIAC